MQNEYGEYGPMRLAFDDVVLADHCVDRLTRRFNEMYSESSTEVPYYSHEVTLINDEEYINFILSEDP